MNEFLDPLINRTFNILWRSGKLLPPPVEIQNTSYEIEYISPLARAQKLDQMKSINSFLALVSQIAVVAPDVIDNVNPDEVVKDIQDLYGVNPKYVRDEADVKQIREQRAEQQAQMAQMAQIQQGVDTVKTASEADANLKPKETNA